MTASYEKRLERAVAGWAGQQKPVPIPGGISVMDMFTACLSPSFVPRTELLWPGYAGYVADESGDEGSEP